MRQAALLALLLCAAACRADRLVDVFTARRVPLGQVRFSWLAPVDRTGASEGYLTLGVTPLVAVEAALDRRAGKSVSTLSGEFNLLPAVRDLSPGVSVGVRDLFDRTPRRRAFYLALTYRATLENDLVTGTPVDLTLGADSRNGAFAGVYLPFSDHLAGIAELESKRATAGFELRPVRGLSLRWLFREQETLIGVGYSVRL